MAKKRKEPARTSCYSKTVYVYDEKLGWIDVIKHLDNLKKVMNEIRV
jgi:hypothetical protein